MPLDLDDAEKAAAQFRREFAEERWPIVAGAAAGARGHGEARPEAEARAVAAAEAAG